MSLPTSKGFAPLILIVAVTIISAIAGFFYWHQTHTNSTSNPNNSSADIAATPSPITGLLQSNSGSKPPASPSTTTSSDLEKRVNSLESSLASLTSRLSLLEQKPQATPAPQAVTSTNKPAAIYIPLGPGSSTQALVWTTTTQPQITLDPADYPGYSSMQLEVSLQVYQGNGQAYARLYNNDDGTSITASEVSTATSDYSWVTSASFQLPSGKKNYRLQLKTNTGYAAAVQFARIKVNF